MYKMIGIYKITNPKGKIYIGQSINIEKRWQKYKYSLINSYSQPKLHRSFKKYGVENHTFNILEECETNILNEKETYWKKHYLKQVNEDFTKVLFCELYDRGGGPKSEKTKQKISEGNKGKPKHTEENKIKFKLLMKGKKPNLGKKFSKEIKEKMSKSHKGKIISDKHKQNISLSRLGHKKTEEWKENLSKSHTKRPVLQYDLSGNFIKEYSSGKNASQELNLSYTAINNALRGISKTSFGYIWKYKN